MEKNNSYDYYSIQENVFFKKFENVYPIPNDNIGAQEDVVNCNKFPINTDSSDTSRACAAMDNYITYFVSGISKLRRNQNQTNTIFKLVEDSFTHAKLFNTRLMEDMNGMNGIEVLDVTTNFICSRLSVNRTKYKRGKRLEENELYVKPTEMAVGL